MTNGTFEEVDGESAVYRPDGFGVTDVIHLPIKARSKFADEYGVPFEDCRAQLVDYHDERYVLVGEIR
jgi:hypothetical protein